MHDESIAVGKIAHRPVTAQDAREFFGRNMPKTFRGLAWTVDDKVVGVIGLVREKVGAKYFGDVLPEFEPRLTEIAAQRPIMKTLKWVQDYPGMVHAVAAHDTGHKLLQRLGFTQFDEDLYLWLNM